MTFYDDIQTVYGHKQNSDNNTDTPVIHIG